MFIEQARVKYEMFICAAYETGTRLRQGLTEYFDFYNGRRIHEALGYATPDNWEPLLSWRPRLDRKIRCGIDFSGYPG